MTITIKHPALRGPKPRRWYQAKTPGFLRDAAQRALVLPAVRMLCERYDVEGLKRLESLDGPAIFVANHGSHFDTPLLLGALPPRLRHRVVVAAAKDYFYGNAAKGATVSLFLNTFPFDRHDGDAALAQAASYVDNGWSLIIYPEGTRSQDGGIGQFKRGVGRLALRLGVPVVPVHLDGSRELMPKGRWLPRRRPVRVRFGEPVTFEHGDPAEVADEARRRVVALAGG